MRIIDQSHEIIEFDPERELYKIARGYCKCYNTPIPKTHKERCALVRRNRKHGSPLEHGYLSVDFTTNRGVSHELVRHRHTAYSQQSTRYCNYSLNKFGSELTFIKDSHVGESGPVYDSWIAGLQDDENRYFERLNLGQLPEEARGVLPNDLATSILVSTNLREWHDILSLRCSRFAHYQIAELMRPLLVDMVEMLPCIYDDISFE